MNRIPHSLADYLKFIETKTAKQCRELLVSNYVSMTRMAMQIKELRNKGIAIVPYKAVPRLSDLTPGTKVYRVSMFKLDSDPTEFIVVGPSEDNIVYARRVGHTSDEKLYLGDLGFPGFAYDNRPNQLWLNKTDAIAARADVINWSNNCGR